MHGWITLPILFGFTAFYLGLSAYIVFRLVSGLALERRQ